MKIDVLVHCGNSPKMEQVINLTSALAKRSPDAAREYVREDFRWSTVGGDKMIRFDELDEKLPQRPEVTSLTICNAMSHGKVAMCEGKLLFADGDKLAFCTVVEFANTAKKALIKSAHTYFVKVKSND